MASSCMLCIICWRFEPLAGIHIIRNFQNFATAQLVGTAQLIHTVRIRSVTGCALRWGRISLNVFFPKKHWKEAQMDVVKS